MSVDKRLRVVRRSDAPVGAGPSYPPDDRPHIVLGPDVERVLRDIIPTLATEDTVFTRSNELVTIVGVVEPDKRTPLAVGSPVIRSHTTPSILPRMTARARYLSPKKDGEMKHSLPPPNVVASLLSLGDWPGIRPLTTISETPFLRPDGTICQVAGYDAMTGVMYLPNALYPGVPDHPSQDDAKLALETLSDVFCDFPFADDASKMVPIAALLTVMSRAAISGAVPAFIFDAATRGSGKTMQADVVSMIATGRSAARCTYPEDDEELSKMMASIALSGSPLFLLDNITRTFGGGPLDLFITAVGDVEFRILGKSETRRVPWLSTILASGNNVAFCDDTLRRVLVGRLESLLEAPESRTDFKRHNLPDWVRAHRADLVVAALTILRAYACHDYPDAGCPRWGSFEAWSRLIPHVIMFAGGVDVMRARPHGERAMTDEVAAMSVILRELPRLDTSGNGMTINTLIGLLYPHDYDARAVDGWEELRESLEMMSPPKYGTKPTVQVVGKRMMKYDGRVFSGKRLCFKLLHGKRLWYVESV